MSKIEKVTKSGFVIKLSSGTVQKIAEEEEKRKLSIEENSTEVSEKVLQPDVVDKIATDQQPTLETSQVPSKNSNNLTTPSSTPPNPTEIEKVTDKKEDKPDEISDSKWGDYAPYITYEGEEALYTDPTSHQQYTWNKETNAWDAKTEVPSRTYSYEDDTHVYTEADGSKFFWDEDKKAWIPKVDDEFLAYYQMSYGFVENAPAEPKPEKDEKKKPDAGLKRKSEPQWFQPSEEKNTKVYVSNLPLDLTEEEFVNFMQKCGLVERDPTTQKMKIKMYMDKDQNCFKGDALCTYIKIESVDLALKLLDGSDLKGNKVSVQRAQFQMKGDYNPALKPKKKKKKELEKIKKMQQKLFDWRPEKFIGERSKHERIVIVKNLFSPSDFDNDVQLILDYQQDLREECSKCGEVRKVVLYDRHPEGVAQITMKEPEQADAVIQLINGRWFGKRQITAETYDGRTKYRIAETDAALNQRINKWDKFLEGGEEGKTEASTPTEGVDTSKKTIEVKTVASTPSEGIDTSKKSIELKTEASTPVEGVDKAIGVLSDGSIKSEDTEMEKDVEMSDETKTKDNEAVHEVVNETCT